VTQRDEPLAFFGLPSVTAEDVAAVAALVEALVKLIAWLAAWLQDTPEEMPGSASLTALAVLVQTNPLVRTELLDRARANPVLAHELRALAEAHGAQLPALAALAADLPQ
jgi:hypothetical protein